MQHCGSLHYFARLPQMRGALQHRLARIWCLYLLLLFTQRSMISVTFDVWACDGIPASYLPYLPSAYFSQPVPHSALASRQLSSSSLNAACLCTMGSLDTEISRCFSCHCMEFDWRVYYEDVYTCSKCKDLDCFES